MAGELNVKVEDVAQEGQMNVSNIDGGGDCYFLNTGFFSYFDNLRYTLYIIFILYILCQTMN